MPTSPAFSALLLPSLHFLCAGSLLDILILLLPLPVFLPPVTHTSFAFCRTPACMHLRKPMLIAMLMPMLLPTLLCASVAMRTGAPLSAPRL